MGRRVAVDLAVGAARMLAHLPPGRIRRVLELLRRGAAAATPPFAAHAWVEVDGRPIGEPADTVTYRHLMTVPPVRGPRDGVDLVS